MNRETDTTTSDIERLRRIWKRNHREVPKGGKWYVGTETEHAKQEGAV